MAIVYETRINQMDCYPEVDGNTDVVFSVHYSMIGTEGEYTGSVYGSVSVQLDADASFTPYADLTAEQVSGWVADALGEDAVAAMHDNIAKQIEDAKNPPVVNPPLPWSV